METLKDFIKKSTFLVTGGAGFIGSNLCEYLVLNYAKKVYCIDNLFNGNLANIAELNQCSNFEFVKGDINDKELLLNLTKNVDYILHQAAWGSVPRSMKMPIEYNKNNVDGTLNVFEVAKMNHVKKVIYASSSSVYGDHPALPKVEGVEGNIISPYALTKKINEMHGKMYWELFQLPTIGLRYFNVFGKKQNPNGEYAAVIPRFIKKVLNYESLEIYGDGMQSRDFTYIEDVIQANLNACIFGEKSSFGKSFNIAYGEKVILKDIIETIQLELNIPVKLVYLNQRPGDIKHSLADISLAKKELKYNPIINFKSGLKLSIHWYKNQS